MIKTSQETIEFFTPGAGIMNFLQILSGWGLIHMFPRSLE